MTDPRNIHHDKKIQNDKKHHGEEIAPGAVETPQPGKKPKHEPHSHDKGGDEAGTDTSAG